MEFVCTRRIVTDLNMQQNYFIQMGLQGRVCITIFVWDCRFFCRVDYRDHEALLLRKHTAETS